MKMADVDLIRQTISLTQAKQFPGRMTEGGSTCGPEQETSFGGTSQKTRLKELFVEKLY